MLVMVAMLANAMWLQRKPVFDRVLQFDLTLPQTDLAGAKIFQIDVYAFSCAYQNIDTMNLKKLEFPRNLLMEEGKGGSLVPTKGETCLLERDSTQF